MAISRDGLQVGGETFGCYAVEEDCALEVGVAFYDETLSDFGGKVPARTVARDDVFGWEGAAAWWCQGAGGHGVAEDVAECWVAGLWVLIFASKAVWLDGDKKTYGHVCLDAEGHDALLCKGFAGVTEVLAATTEAVLDEHQGGWCAVGEVPLHVVGCAADSLGGDNAGGCAGAVAGALG